jgi:hypothetical protein
MSLNVPSDDYFEVGYHVDRYHELEEDLVEFLRFMPLEVNDSVEKRKSIKSPYLADLLLRIGSNIDIFFRKLITKKFQQITDEKKGKFLSFNDYKKLENILTIRGAKLSTSDVRIIQTKEHLFPFKNWNNETPDWWKSYNHVKHEAKFEEANLDNVIQALSALLLLISFQKNSSKLLLYDYLTINPIAKREIILGQMRELHHPIITKLFVSPIES